MSDEQQTFTLDDVKKMVNEAIEPLKTDLQQKDEHIKRLNEESKNKRLETKDITEFFADKLGLKQGEEIPETEVIKNSVAGMAEEFKNLKAEISKKDEMLFLEKKQREAEKVANSLNIDGDYLDLAMSKVDLRSEIPIKEQLDVIVAKYPKILKQADSFGTGNMPNAGTLTTLQQEFEALVSKPKLTNADKARLEILPSLLKKHKGK